MDDFLNICLRLVLATCLGMLIGLDRAIAEKDAGVRTHAILALSTCSLTLLVMRLVPSEIVRVIAGIVQGIGFIGAGVIFTVHQDEKEKEVVGVTSSAILWLTGIVGIISGTDYWYMVFPICIIYFILNYPVRLLEEKIRNK